MLFLLKKIRIVFELKTFSRWCDCDLLVIDDDTQQLIVVVLLEVPRNDTQYESLEHLYDEYRFQRHPVRDNRDRSNIVWPKFFVKSNETQWIDEILLRVKNHWSRQNFELIHTYPPMKVSKLVQQSNILPLTVPKQTNDSNFVVLVFDKLNFCKMKLHRIIGW